MMKEQKRRGGLFQAALGVLILYLAAALPSAAVYGFSQLGREDAPSASPVPELVSQASESALPEASPKAPAGFLDGLPLPESGTKPDEEDSFTLKDSASGQTLTVPARELIPAAVACEMDPAAPEEALKAQAVACYTLFCRKRSAGEAIECDSAAWQTWTTEEAMRERWGEGFDGCYASLRKAADEVRGQLLTWEGEPILAAYFAISAGSTETAGNTWQGDLPYLKEVASPGDMFSDGYLSRETFTQEDFKKAACAYFGGEELDFSGEPASWLSGIERSPSGYVTAAVLGGKKVRGVELRSAFSLRSACFTVDHQDGGFTFTVRGWGHGVGMSQTGAAFLAKRGVGYKEILAHYYPGAELTVSP